MFYLLPAGYLKPAADLQALIIGHRALFTVYEQIAVFVPYQHMFAVIAVHFHLLSLNAQG